MEITLQFTKCYKKTILKELLRWNEYSLEECMITSLALLNQLILLSQIVYYNTLKMCRMKEYEQDSLQILKYMK